jgi:hypothetical protein
MKNHFWRYWLVERENGTLQVRKLGGLKVPPGTYFGPFKTWQEAQGRIIYGHNGQKVPKTWEEAQEQLETSFYSRKKRNNTV